MWQRKYLIILILISVVMVMPVKWFITGDKDKAIQTLTGLGKRLLYTVKNWRQIGNLYFKDSGIITYADGSQVRAISSGDYDQIHLYAPTKGIGEEEKKEEVLYLAGYYKLTFISSPVWIMEKRTMNGKVLWSVTTDFGNAVYYYNYSTERYSWGPNGMCLDNSGIYYVGNDSGNYPYWVLEKRNKSTGALIYHKDILYGDVADGDNQAYGIASDGTYLYIVGSYYNTTSSEYIAWIAKFNADDGTQEWKIDSTHVNGGIGTAVKVSKDGYIYNLFYEYYGDHWVSQKRNADSGSIIWEHIDSAAGVFGYVPNQNALDHTGVYEVGSKYSSGKTTLRVAKRALDTGDVEWEWIEDNVTPIDARLHDIKIYGSKIYVSGATGSPVKNRTLCFDKSDGTNSWSYLSSYGIPGTTRYCSPNASGISNVFVGTYYKILEKLSKGGNLTKEYSFDEYGDYGHISSLEIEEVK